MKRTLYACLVGLALAASAAGPSGAQRPSQPEREAAKQKRKPRLYAKRAGVEVPTKPLLSRMEKLVHPKDKTKTFDFKVEVVDVGGLDVVSQELSDDLKKLIITVRNNGAVTPDKTTYLAVYVVYYILYGTHMQIPVPQFDFVETTEVPSLKPNKEFVYEIDLAKKGVVLVDFHKGDGPVKGGKPLIGVECYVMSGSFGLM